MALPPLLAEHPRPVQAVLAIVVPAVFGAITGIFLGISEPVYVVLALLGVLGGVAAGFDHLGAADGARRGALGGVLFGGFILIAHELSGEEAEAHLPEPAVVLVVVTTVLGVLLGALGGWLRARAQRRAPEPARP
jgi:hypothetical protein